ncbi:MAG TPA: peptidylprolyl isomerase [Gammaproteobacteria bacterium]|nr:peptidylprolyl isomerase [Gammaproteobacteria bacterium]
MRLPTARLCLLLTTCLVASSASFAQDKAAPATTPTSPRVRVVTSAGNFVIELDRARAPLTVDAFMGYVNIGFYAGTIFHRVVAGFVAQTGGYTKDFQQKPVTANVQNESGNGLSNLRGTVGFARGPEPHSGTSQFYVNLADNLDLNPRPTRWGYAVFGKVVEGMEVVDEIGHRPTGPGGPFDRSVPVDPVVIEKIELLP